MDAGHTAAELLQQRIEKMGSTPIASSLVHLYVRFLISDDEDSAQIFVVRLLKTENDAVGYKIHACGRRDEGEVGGDSEEYTLYGGLV